MDLDRIDRLTPRWKGILQGRLSVQERQVLISIVRFANGGPLFIKDLPVIQQANHRATVFGRLVKKGFLERVTRGLYKPSDPDLVDHIRARCSRQTRSAIEDPATS